MRTEPFTEEEAASSGWPCYMCQYDYTTMQWRCRGCTKATKGAKPSRWKLKEEEERTLLIHDT